SWWRSRRSTACRCISSGSARASTISHRSPPPISRGRSRGWRTDAGHSVRRPHDKFIQSRYTAPVTMPTIVISYRRADAAGTAGRMFDRLKAHFGDGSVFMDIDRIPAGANFRQHIKGILTSSDIVLAIIGPRWMGDGGRRRISDDGDLVRFEVETALEEGIPLIPVLVDHATMPATRDLPDSLREIADLNAAEVSPGRDFHVHMYRLIRSIEKELAAQSKRKAT